MAATARVTVLFDPAEKAALQSHAAAAKISTGEYIKRAVSAYDADVMPDAETMAQLEAYAELLESAAKTMGAQIDASIAKIDRMLDPTFIAEERARIEREVAEMDLTGVRERLGLTA